MRTNFTNINNIGHSVETTPNGQSVQPNKVKLSSSALHDSIVARRATGESIASIARSLNCTRQTVYAHLRNVQAIDAIRSQRIDALVEPALDAIERSLKAGDGKLAHAILKDMNVLGTSTHGKTSDNSLTVAINTLITPATTSTTITPSHPSGQEGEGDDLNLSVHGQNLPKLGPPAPSRENFSQIIDVEEVK